MTKMRLSLAAAMIMGAAVIPWAASAQIGTAARTGIAEAAKANEAGHLTLVRRSRRLRGSRGFRRRGFSGRGFRGSRRAFRGRSFRRFRGRIIVPGIALGLAAPYFDDESCWDERLVPTRYGWRWSDVWVC